MPSKNKQVKYNFYSNIAALLANVIVGIMYIPYLVDSIGLTAYGIIPLTLIINQYISVFTGSLTSALTRFYSVSIHKCKAKEASSNLSTAFVIVGVLSVLCIVVMRLITTNISHIFEIPKELIESAQILFSFTIMSLVLSLFSSVLNVVVYAQNRLDVLNLIKSIRILLKFALIVILFYFIDKDVKYVGVANVFTEFFLLILSIVFFVKFSFNRVKISIKLFRKTTFVTVLGMTTWVILHQIGDVGIYRVDIFAVNKAWGLIESGALGAVSEFGTYVMMVVSLIAALFGPLILIAYSKSNHDEVVLKAKNSSYISGAIGAVLAGLIAGYSVSILRNWLGEDYVQYSSWLSIKMVSLPFFAAGGVLAFVYRSWNKVKAPAITTLCIGLLNIAIIVIAITQFRDFISVSLIIIMCVCFAILQSFFMNVYFVNKIYNGIYKDLILSSLKFTIIFSMAFGMGKVVEMVYLPSNLIELFLILGLSSMLLFAVVYIILFNSNHKKQLIEIIK